jgi:hypothetical protein
MDFDDFSLVDEFSLAAAIRATGVAQGDTALVLATALVLRLGTPTPEMVAEAAIERAAKQSEFYDHCADFGAEP